jgi:2-polyprenyl-3-methyl-5-hydroxy-6-metoxy-1,4-benzoquinol methylase
MSEHALRCLCGAALTKPFLETDGRYEQPYDLFRCPCCDLISPDPLPDEAMVEAQYDAYGSYADPDYHGKAVARRRVQAERLRRRLERLVGRDPRGLRFLEIGCAAGALLVNLVELGFSEVRGVEIDRANASVAQRHLGDRVLAGTLASAAFANDSFDVVYAEQVIEHVPRADLLLEECRRVLRPGGILIAATPNFDGLSARALGLGWKEFYPSEHVRMFTRHALDFHVVRAGFREVQVRTAGLSMIRRSDGKDLARFRRGRLAMRGMVKGIGLIGIGDTLDVVAFKPRHAA